MRRLVYLVPILYLLIPIAFATDDDCGDHKTLGEKCWLKVLDLHPTQHAIGMREVMNRKKKLEDMNGSDLKDYLKSRPVPVAIGPHEIPYMTDHHHLTRALWQAGIKKAYIEVQQDWSSLSAPAFWKKMEEKSWVYPRDQFGAGPHTHEFLPPTVMSLADDPYRDLSREVERAGGYEDTNIFCAEFLWADYFRSRIPVLKVRNDFDRSVEKALTLVHLPEAKALPGFIPPGR